MRIAIDACCWSNRRGFGRYTRELVSHLLAAPAGHDFILVVDRLTSEQHVFPPGASLHIVPTTEQPTQAASADGSRSIRDLWRMGRAFGRVKADLIFFPAVYSYSPVLARVPTIVTFHDAIAESHPDLIFPSRRARLFWNLKTWWALRQADRVLTVSQSAKRQIVQAFNYPASKIHVIFEAAGDEFRVMENREAIHAALERYKLPRDLPLILYVGGISPHKNLDTLLRALKRLHDSGVRTWRMVIVGDYQHDSFFGCYQEISTLCKQLGLTDRVSFTGFVPNEDLVGLYNAAKLLVLPSLSEGFGLPVVEAMACGVPVAVSDRGSLPEIVGNAGVTYDPQDEAAMAKAIAGILGDDAIHRRLRAEGLRRAVLFSWKTAARQAIELFEDTVGKVHRSRE